MLIYYKDYVTEESWNERFDLPMDLFLLQVADTNMRIFMDKATEEDKQVQDSRVPRTTVKKPGHHHNNSI